MRFSILANGLLFGMLLVPLRAAEPVDYSRQIKPLLAKHCQVCHSPLRQKSGYRMDTVALLIQGGDSGPAVVPGKSAESHLIQAVTGSKDVAHMPPEDAGERLTAEQIDLLKRWIDEGAHGPAESPAPDPRKHWSFQPLERPPVPTVKNAAWVRNPIDSFIVAEYERRRLQPRGEADKAVLLRRVYLDLIGLPPTGEALHAFLDDGSPDAYERVVDRLLASSAYGERWGRHWMDVWRYSDWAGWGQQVRDSQPHIWHWRDWIIESLNSDLAYDQMVVDMLAADELAPGDQDRLRATGFLARNFKLLSREQWLQDTVEHTSKAFLGLTMNCARCHDHMTDPLEQDEYYQFRAIFEPYHVRLDRLPGVADVAIDGLPRVFDKEPAAQTYFYTRGDERTPRKDRVMAAGVPALLRTAEFQIREVTLPRQAFDPARQDFVILDDLAASAAKVKEARDKIEKLKAKSAPDATALELAEAEHAATESQHLSLIATVTVEQLEARDQRSTPAWTTAAKAALDAQRQSARVVARRNVLFAKHEQEAQSKELENARKAAGVAADDVKDPKIAPLATKLAATSKKLTEAEAEFARAEGALKQELTTAYTKRAVTTYPATSTGRRLALARWIVDSSNPLAARVAANHLWSRHFHAALVPSVFNFGISGERPINQPLLDWLAAELMSPQYSRAPAAWTMKAVHRLIVTSRTYRLSSTNDPANYQLDPDNRWWWRAPTRRMEAEAIRDSVFAVCGELDRTMGGADLDHAQGLSTKRRSLYFRHAAEKQMLLLKLFDCANVTECYERNESVMPQQALALANSELTWVQARSLARRLHPEYSADNQQFVTAAIEQVLGRLATASELSMCAEFLTTQENFFAENRARLTDVASTANDASKPSADPMLRAREQFVHALLNLNDFVTIR